MERGRRGRRLFQRRARDAKRRGILLALHGDTCVVIPPDTPSRPRRRVQRAPELGAPYTINSTFGGNGGRWSFVSSPGGQSIGRYYRPSLNQQQRLYTIDTRGIERHLATLMSPRQGGKSWLGAQVRAYMEAVMTEVKERKTRCPDRGGYPCAPVAAKMIQDYMKQTKDGPHLQAFHNWRTAWLQACCNNLPPWWTPNVPKSPVS